MFTYPVGFNALVLRNTVYREYLAMMNLIQNLDSFERIQPESLCVLVYLLFAVVADQGDVKELLSFPESVEDSLVMGLDKGGHTDVEAIQGSSADLLGVAGHTRHLEHEVDQMSKCQKKKIHKIFDQDFSPSHPKSYRDMGT